MKPKPINWEARAVKAEAEAREATAKYIHSKWDRGDPLLVLAVWLVFVCFCVAIASWGYIAAVTTRPFVVQPYPVLVYKETGPWHDRCRRAWKVLEHAHSGPHNSVAFKILNGDDERK